jgi:HAD superfamily phosphoserine phosphatase-like hydrolase
MYERNPMTKKLVVFDFCDTIANFQTADAFVSYVNGKYPNKFNLLVFWLRKVLVKLRFFAVLNKFLAKRNSVKRFFLWSLKGQSKDIIDYSALEFFNQKIVPNYHQTIIEKVRYHVENKDIVVVSSGGYDLYVKHFCQQEKIHFFNCTKIAFKVNKCLGVFDGLDCMFDQKVIEIEALIRDNNWQFQEKIVYSDSITDMPLFLWADKPIVVSKHSAQLWAAENTFDEIIIKE